MKIVPLCIASIVFCADAPSVTIGPTRLVIARDGATLIREGAKPQRFKSLAELFKASPGLRGSFEVEHPAPLTGERDITLEAREGRLGNSVTISPGEIPALEFVRYIADATGLPILHDSTDRAVSERMINVAAPMRNVGIELVKALLEANHIRVTESSSGSEGRVLRVESMDTPGTVTEPKAVPIFDVKEGPLWHPNPEAAQAARRTAKGPQDGPARLTGMVIEAVPEILRAQLDMDVGRGVLISELDESAVKESKLLSVLKRFDVVTHVEDRGINTPAQLVEAINALPQGLAFQFRLIRKGTTAIVPARK